MLIDDFDNEQLISKLGCQWNCVSDEVMGGISKAKLSGAVLDGKRCLRLMGTVHLENNGGFIQAALDLADAGEFLDASPYLGIRLFVQGNGERYGVHLRTSDNQNPWESYRAHFVAGKEWSTATIAFQDFVPHRTEAPLDTACLRRIGIVAIGRPFDADVALSKLLFYS